MQGTFGKEEDCDGDMRDARTRRPIRSAEALAHDRFSSHEPADAVLNATAWQGEALPPLDPPSLRAGGAVGDRVAHPEHRGRPARKAATGPRERFARPVALPRAVGKLASGDVLRGGSRRFRRSATAAHRRRHAAIPPPSSARQRGGCRGQSLAMAAFSAAPPLSALPVTPRGPAIVDPRPSYGP